jgi:hypothetical protein
MEVVSSSSVSSMGAADLPADFEVPAVPVVEGTLVAILAALHTRQELEPVKRKKRSILTGIPVGIDTARLGLLASIVTVTWDTVAPNFLRGVERERDNYISYIDSDIIWGTGTRLSAHNQSLILKSRDSHLCWPLSRHTLIYFI